MASFPDCIASNTALLVIVEFLLGKYLLHGNFFVKSFFRKT